MLELQRIRNLLLTRKHSCSYEVSLTVPKCIAILRNILLIVRDCARIVDSIETQRIGQWPVVRSIGLEYTHVAVESELSTSKILCTIVVNSIYSRVC